MNKLIFSFLVVLVAAGCSSMSKKCSDGVCVIEENGQRRYEGDPQKIAALQKKDADQQKQEVDLQKAYDKAPRRTSGEVVNVGFVIFKPMQYFFYPI